MDSETVIQSILEIANNGFYANGAVELLQNELKELYSPIEIRNIIKVAQRSEIAHNKKKFSECIYELLSNKIFPISHGDNIKEWLLICSLLNS